jgi:RimJ/RimL family protein N-acetyltransferase
MNYVNHDQYQSGVLNMMKIGSTDRLRFSMMSASDADLLYELDQDEAVMQYINGGNKTSKQDIEQIFIPRLESYRNTEKGHGLWKVLIKQSEEFIGWVLVRPMHFFSGKPEWHNIELGWRFKQSSWGKGYATEAALAIKAAMTKQQGIKKFSAIAMEQNHDSVSIMSKLNMHYCKTDWHRDPLGDLKVVYYETKVD